MKNIKGTNGKLDNLIEGTLTNFIKCINVNYKSERDEQFKFLSL